MVARLAGVSALGAFGVALIVWLAVVGINRALVSEPMTVTGGPEIGVGEQREGMAASALVGLAIAALLAVGCLVGAEGGLNVVGVLALAPWLPSLLVQDYCRAAAFRIRRPQVALASDVVFATVQVGCTVALAYAGLVGVGAFHAAGGSSRNSARPSLATRAICCCFRPCSGQHRSASTERPPALSGPSS
jgi:hypothetical protein